ncbi:cobyrinate a,c-diamide synthase [Shewanella schlegeliana]|uniref:Cobyrinate a,c-diamide synthase n=1 Tax=Shewanella schlegeliana TaxID=190308 RepID=A0ABS1SZR7_9GAMM|nr:cobyrinate a,c-diamide synthase [Shewanella schlegeliana]MBL4914023.1 cobyrinate a,c-diamide synthase [Shewanella schlegeliana]MCL1108594.1 cobyrinate a,c-diamide synthase [Shewanella schlegeliana]GIU35703.1 cobyrinic acid a,c-diamide synthase [Shewanella schlegeliana]
MSHYKAYCPALFITAPSSDSGKTTLVSAMARYWRNQGKNVRVFKTGPDFIDPIFHEFASGQPAHQLDLGMMGESICKQHLYQAAIEADLILVEGVMGMFDGANNSASLAAKFGIPMLAVIPADKMAQTFGAIAYGLAHYQKEVNLFGVIANYVGSPGHAAMLKDSLPNGITFCGAMPRDPSLALPERHLGLVQAQEIEAIDEWLEHTAKVLGENCELPLPEPVCFEAVSFELEQDDNSAFLSSELLSQSLSQSRSKTQSRPLTGQTIAVAKDAAFSFIYHDNITLLQSLGASIRYFSPIHDGAMPEADSLYLPGGYPELHLNALSDNTTMCESIKRHIDNNKPTLAECGGMLYLLETLGTNAQETAPMVGALPGSASMQSSLQGLGMLSAEINGYRLTGHCFHYSKSSVDLAPIAIASQSGKTQMQEPVFVYKNTLGSYVHWYLPSSPQLVCQLFLGLLSQGQRSQGRLSQGQVSQERFKEKSDQYQSKREPSNLANGASR